MAYGLKYKLDYCNDNNVAFRLEIEVDGYSGPSYSVASNSEPFVLNKANSNKFSKLEIIKGSFADINIYKDENFNIDALLTSSETAIRVKHYKGGSLNWTGFVLPEFFHEVVGEGIITMTASDRLGTLKDVPMPVDYSLTTFLDAIRTCLMFTGVLLPIKTIIGYKLSSDVVQGMPLKNVIQGERFSNQQGKRIGAFDALRSMLLVFNCSIEQHDGYWLICNLEQKESGQGSVVIYDYQVGSTEAVSVTPFVQNVIDLGDVDENPNRSVKPILSSVSILGEHGGPRVYPRNNNFDSFVGGQFSGWTAHKGFVVKNYKDNPIKYNADGTINTAFSIEGDNNKLLNSNVTLGSNTNYNSWPYLQSEPIDIAPFIVGYMANNDQNKDLEIKLNYNITGKNSFLSWYSFIIDTGRATNRYMCYNATKGFVNAGNDLNNIYAATGRGGLRFKGIVNKDDALAANTLSSVDTMYVPADLLKSISKLSLIFRVMSVESTGVGSSPNPELIVNSVTFSFDADRPDQRGDLYRIDQVGNYTAKTTINTAIFSDHLTAGINGRFYNYPKDDTASIIPVGSTSWQTVGDNRESPVLLHSVRQMARLYSAPHNEFDLDIDLDDIDPLTIFRIPCSNEKYIITRYTINHFTREAVLLLAQISVGNGNTVEYIYSYFGTEEGTNVAGVGSISGGGGGGGSAPQDLAKTLEIGNVSLAIGADIKGTYNNDFNSIPDKQPDPSDVKVGKTFIWSNDLANPGEDPDPSINGYLRDLLDVDVAGVLNGQALTYDAAKNKWVPATPLDLTGYARESWVISQDYAPKSWVIVQGYLTKTVADGIYKPLSYVPSWWEITGKPLISVEPLANSIVQRNTDGNINGGYFHMTGQTVDEAIVGDMLTTSGDGWIRKSSKQAVNQFLGMPTGGDTLQSVMDRGSITSLSAVYRGNSVGIIFDNPLGQTAGVTHQNSGVSYWNINMGAGDGSANYNIYNFKTTTRVLSLNYNDNTATFSNKVIAAVMQPDALILPTAPPTNAEANATYFWSD